MKDVHQKAQDRAQQRVASPPDSHNTPGSPQVTGNMAFASERERAKEALRTELNNYSSNNIHKIAALTQTTDDGRILRVAAYCRVSTDDEDQVSSMELQKKAYKELITNNPNWVYYGTFVDDGYSGTNTEHRRAFQLMMKHAEQGKFDMIVTKSVSRFARNLIDCITWVRALQDHDPPIAVYFEQEGINTLNTSSNIILFVLAMVAEEESHMKSEAMLLSLEWRFSRGRFLLPSILGYDKVIDRDETGTIIRRRMCVNEDEARTVRLMYYMLVNGASLTTIADTLTELKRETGWHKISSKFSNTEWTPGAVRNVLRNQKYCGDILARKTWTPDFHDHKSRPNRGSKNKYYQADHHEAIVPRSIWNAAQRILNSNRYRGAGSYLPMRVIDHGILCGFISMNRSWAGFTLDDYFYVCSVAMGKTEGTLEADLENEHLPEGGYAMGTLTGDSGVLKIARQLSKEEIRARAELEGRVAEEEIPTVKPGYQVVDADMFSHAYDPVVRFTRNSIAFNSTCIGKLINVYTAPDGLDTHRCQYVEFLFNPIEKMVAVRPCSKDLPNAIRWANDNGRSVGVGATALCKTIFTLQNWDTDYSFRVPVSVMQEDDHKQQLLGYFQDHYLSRQDVLFKLPLNISIESFWQDLVNQRKARATMLPLYSATGQPYWFVTTDKMVKASERLCEEAMKHDSFFDPYRIPLSQALTSALSQEAYFTSFVEGADYPIQAAVDFLRRGSEPENAYEQNIMNNYQAGAYLLSALSIPFDETFVKELSATLSEGQDGYRTTDTPAIPAMEGEAFKVPPAHMLADRMGQFYAFLADVRVHPLIKSAVGQAYILAIRPFQEANERLGRLISNAVLLRYGYDFFLDISISAYIARESYRYFKAMREIIRSDNEGDLTYFVEYYLELLVRALDETRMEEAERLQSQLESERKMALQPLKQPTVQYTQPHNYSAEAVARVIDSAESERDTEETAHVLQEERSTAPDPPTLPDGDASYRSSQSQAGSTQGDSKNAALRAAAQGCPCPPLLGLTDKLLDKIGKMLDTEISPFTSNQWAQTMGCNFVEGRNECREMFLLGLADRVPKNNVFLYTFNFSRADYTTAYQEISGGRIIEPVTKKQWNHALSILEQAGIEYIDKTVAFIRECVEMGRTTFFLTDLCQYGSVQDKQCSVAVQTLVDRGIIVLPKKKNMKHRIVVPMTESDTDRELLQADVACQERESQSIMVPFCSVMRI